MNILLLGSGGREHALAWKMSQSYHCDQLFIAPGNAGTAQFGKNLAVGVNDFNAIRTICLENKIGMLVVGPEDPLVNGVYDYFQHHDDLAHITVVAPSAAAAQLEGSKAFSKKFMQRHGIPTAAYAEFTKAEFEAGKKYIAAHSLPVVLKADGLAAGKGVIIAETTADALKSFEEMIIHEQFGAASSKVVVEEFLKGIEVSVFVLTDGKDYQIIGHAKDYKRIGEGDTGLNTGGMGCVSPVPFMDEVFMKKVTQKIIDPTVAGLNQEGLVYHGFIFFGLMNVAGEPWVIEYNCRMGDPETEVVLPLLETDLVGLFAAMDNGTLADVNINFSSQCCATVMAVSGGYPGDYQKGMKITGLDGLDVKVGAETLVFHAGTVIADDEVQTNGGRVLAVSSYGESLPEAVAKSIAVLKNIHFEGIYYRKDIGFEFPS